MSDKCYSRNGEYYTDIDAVHDDLRCDYADGEDAVIYEADSELATHESLLSVDYLVENMIGRAYDNYDEWAEHYLEDLDKKKRESLAKHILEWFGENAKKPNFYSVTNAEMIDVKVGEY